jgi:uncharacterized membrane protein
MPTHSDTTERQLAQLPLIGWALVLGATIFAGVAVALPFLGSADAEPAQDAGVVPVLSLVHGFVLVNALVLATVLPRKLRERPGGAASAQIVRWALVEGAALLGCVVVLIAGTGGVLPGQPVYYANLVSLGALWLVVARDTAAAGAR